MPQFTKRKLAIAILPISLTLIGCQDDDTNLETINAPTTFEFTSKTNPAANSSVEYSQAVTLHILINELEAFIDSEEIKTIAKDQNQGKTKVLELLNIYYEKGTRSQQLINLKTHNVFTGESTATPLRSFDTVPSTLQTNFSELADDVAIKQLMPGIKYDLHYRNETDPELGNFMGWSILGYEDEDQTPDALIQYLFDTIARLAVYSDPENSPYYVEAKKDYKELLISFLKNAIPYSEAMNYHLNPEIGLSESNLATSDDYTQLEHQWDLAFGYYGLSRTPLTKASITMSPYHDSNADGVIDLYSEYNFHLPVYAANNDTHSPYSETNFYNDMSEAFLGGRTIIQQNFDSQLTQSNLDFIKFSNTLTITWGKIIASQAVHYLNIFSADVLKMGKENATPDAEFGKHWAQLKGIVLGLQVISDSPISDEDMKTVQDNIGMSPEIRDNLKNGYFSKLIAARDIIQASYQFSSEDTGAW